jgi:uncharacterized C2H2 Zn-finger protein
MGFFGKSENLTKCKECGLEFSDPERLKRHHEKAHEKLYEKCRVCGAQFHTSDDLRKHKKKCK